MPNLDIKKILKELDKQNKEFDAVEALAKAYKNITLVPVVDDDYPEVRHIYESCVKTIIDAFKLNGRIK